MAHALMRFPRIRYMKTNDFDTIGINVPEIPPQKENNSAQPILLRIQ